MLKKVLLAMLIVSNAYAEQIPTASSKDYRIKFVEYDPYNIVKINTTQAFATQITFNEDENIENIMFGVKDNWVKNSIKNILYIKPKVTAVDNSNILVKTNKRTYSLLANVCPDDCGKKLTYNLIYTYDKNDKNQLHQEQKTAKYILDNYKSNYKNYQYTAQGNQELRPIDTWDNGQFTYLKFASHKNMPSVYLIQDDKNESLTNSHIEKNTIVLHHLAKTFILRAGKKVLAIHNENYDKTVKNHSNTSSLYVQRVNKDE